jgi:hypothetical protein
MKKIEDSPLKNQADGQPIYRAVMLNLCAAVHYCAPNFIENVINRKILVMAYFYGEPWHKKG